LRGLEEEVGHGGGNEELHAQDAVHLERRGWEGAKEEIE